MKKISIVLVSLILGASLLQANSDEHSSAMKCGVSMKVKEKKTVMKCGVSMNMTKKKLEKKETAGKCGASHMKMSAGKCGEDK